MKNLVWISLIAILVMAMAGIGTSNPTTIVYVDPQVNSGDPSETFTVSIKVSDAENAFLSHVEIAFDPGLIEVVDDPATSDIEGIDVDDLNPQYFEYLYDEKVYIEHTPYGTFGMAKVVTGREIGVKEGLNGTVGLAKITFHVKSWGKTIIKVYFSDIINIDGDHVEVYAEDGYFSNVNPILWIKKKGAHGVGVWPDWHTGAVSTPNGLHATVVNTGMEAANTRVVFVITGPAGTVMMTAAEQTIPAGDKRTFDVSCDASEPGDYTFYAYIEYEVHTWVWKNWKLECQEAFGGEGYSYLKGTGKFKAA